MSTRLHCDVEGCTASVQIQSKNIGDWWVIRRVDKEAVSSAVLEETSIPGLPNERAFRVASAVCPDCVKKLPALAGGDRLGDRMVHTVGVLDPDEQAEQLGLGA